MKNDLDLFKSIVSVVIGALAIILALVCFFSDTGVFERESAYGGDAYTGIQNAGAVTANNVKCAALILSRGFGALLLIIGFVFISQGAFGLIDKKRKQGASPSDNSAHNAPNRASGSLEISASTTGANVESVGVGSTGTGQPSPQPNKPKPPVINDDE